MGRIFEELTRSSKSGPAANPANLASTGEEIRGFAEIAATPVSDEVLPACEAGSSADRGKGVCDEAELRKRCEAVCSDLSIPAEVVFGEMIVEDREAQYTGLEGYGTLRAFAESLSTQYRGAELNR